MGVSAQNYTLTAYDTVYYGNPGDLFIPSVTLTNTSNDTLYMMARRIVRNVPAGWNSCFCFPYCVPQTQDTLLFFIPPNEGKNTNVCQVAPNFGTDSIPGIGVVVVVITEIGKTQMDTVTYRGITNSPAGIEAQENASLYLYPNPAGNSIWLDDPKNTIRSLSFYGLGGDVLNLPPSQWSGGAIDISGLTPGIYTVGILNAQGRTTFVRFVKSE